VIAARRAVARRREPLRRGVRREHRDAFDAQRPAIHDVVVVALHRRSLPSRTAAIMPQPHEQKLHEVVNSLTSESFRSFVAACIAGHVEEPADARVRRRRRPSVLDYWAPNGMLLYRNVQVFWRPLQGATRVTVALERPGVNGDSGIYADRIDLENIRPRFPAPDLTAEYRVAASGATSRRRGCCAASTTTTRSRIRST
jgi:hypothetical protein